MVINDTIKIDYDIERIIKSKVELALREPYYIRNKDRYYIKSDKVINDIINYLRKHNMTYYISNGLIKLNGEFYSQYSNKEDYPKNYEEALRDFISSIKYEVLNMIQNPYFDKDKLRWNIK